MIKKFVFLCIIFIYGINAHGQFNTIMSKKAETPPTVIQPLYGPCLYEIDNEEVIDSVAVVVPSEINESLDDDGDAVVGDVFEEMSVKGKTVAYNEDEMFLFRQLVALPLDTCVITSKFGQRVHPIEKILKQHDGIDLKADSSYVYSVMPGRVLKVGKNRRSGNFVVVEHGSYQSIYCHLRKAYVDKSDYVDAGQIVGLSGNTGFSTGEHLHFALKHQGKYINPEPFLKFVSALIGFVDFKLLELQD